MLLHKQISLALQNIMYLLRDAVKKKTAGQILGESKLVQLRQLHCGWWSGAS